MEQLKDKRKLLTLNAHSWIEENSEEKFQILVKAVENEQYDVIALQEINQLAKSEVVPEDSPLLERYVPIGELPPVKENNFVLQLVRELEQRGLFYYWSWVPSHRGYEGYEEGLAMMSLKPITAIKKGFASKAQTFYEFARAVIGICVEDTWFYSVHFSRWDEEEDNFKYQWDSFLKLSKDTMDKKVYVMGDFNCPAYIKGEGYSYVVEDGTFRDCYMLAKEKLGEYTVPEVIDGWRDTKESIMRIDFVFANYDADVVQYQVVFDGERGEVVSDHYGVVVIV